MRVAAAQILIEESGKTAGPAIGYSGKDPAGGTSFADMIRPQVTGEETVPVSVSPSEGTAERGLVPQEMPASAGGPASDGQPMTRVAWPAILPGARASAASGATRSAGEAEYALAALGRAAGGESTPSLGASSTKSTPADPGPFASGSGARSLTRRPAPETGEPGGRGGTQFPGPTPGETIQISVPGDSSRAQSLANGLGSAAAPPWRFSDPVTASLTALPAPAGPGPSRSSAPLAAPLPEPCAPLAAHISPEHAGFGVGVERSGGTDSAAPAPPAPGTIREEKKTEDSPPSASKQTGQVGSSAKPAAAPAHSEIMAGAVQGAVPQVGRIGVGVRAGTIAVAPPGGVRNNHGLFAPAIGTAGGQKESETPAARAHAVLPSQSTVAAGQQGDLAAAGSGAAAAAPAAMPAEARMQVVTTDPRAASRPLEGAGRDATERAAASRKTSSGGEIVQGGTQGSGRGVEVSAEAVDAGREGPAKAGHSRSSPWSADSAGLEGIDKASGHTVGPTFAGGPAAPTAGNPGAASQVMAPAVLAAHAGSGMAAIQPAIPVTSAPHPAHVPASAAFERMDSGAAPQAIESTPQRLAVGVRSPGLGWVEIRTSNTAGQVSATVATGSAESHSAVSAQLPSVREFLAGEHVRIDTLASERFPASAGGGGEGNSRGQSGNEARNEARNDNGSEGGDSAKSEGEAIAARTSSATAEMESLSYINVRA